MEWTNLNYVVHSSEQASELVVDTKLKPCALLVHKGVTFSLSTTVVSTGLGLPGRFYLHVWKF